MQITHALTVQQPWASALVRAQARKPIENRYSVAAIDHPPIAIPPGWIGIHASATVHPRADLCPGADPDAPRSALIGAVRVVRWLRASEALQRADLAPWVLQPTPAEIAALTASRTRPTAQEGWCLLMDAAIGIAPIPMAGALGLWRLPEPVELVPLPRRGRPPVERRRRSGQHRRVEGPELVEQRRRLLADLVAALPDPRSELARLLAAIPVDVPAARLPAGYGAQLAAAIGWPERSGAGRLSQVWAGVRPYRPVF